MELLSEMKIQTVHKTITLTLFCPARADAVLGRSGWDDTRGFHTAQVAGLVEAAEPVALGVLDGIVTRSELNFFKQSWCCNHPPLLTSTVFQRFFKLMKKQKMTFVNH